MENRWRSTCTQVGTAREGCKLWCGMKQYQLECKGRCTKPGERRDVVWVRNVEFLLGTDQNRQDQEWVHQRDGACLGNKGMEVSLRWFGHEQRRDRKYISCWNWQAEGPESAHWTRWREHEVEKMRWSEMEAGDWLWPRLKQTAQSGRRKQETYHEQVICLETNEVITLLCSDWG